MAILLNLVKSPGRGHANKAVEAGVHTVCPFQYKITEYGTKCCMHAHIEAPRAPPSRGEWYRSKT